MARKSIDYNSPLYDPAPFNPSLVPGQQDPNGGPAYRDSDPSPNAPNTPPAPAAPAAPDAPDAPSFPQKPRGNQPFYGQRQSSTPPPNPADLSGFRQAQNGSFPNSFVNLQAYLNANPNAPAYNQPAPTGNYSQGQSNLDTMLRSASYGPQSVGPPTPQPFQPQNPNSLFPANSSSTSTPQQGAPSGGGSSGPTGPTPQPGSAAPTGPTPQPGWGQQPVMNSRLGAMTGGQNQSVADMAQGTTFQSPVQKDRPFPRLQTYLGA